MRWLIALHNQAQFLLLSQAPAVATTPPRIRGAACGGPMRVVFVAAHDPPYFDTS